MATYKYAARDFHGKHIAGTIDARDESELRKTLRMNELFLISYSGEADGKKPSVDSQNPSIFDFKPSLQDLVIAMRQLGATVRAGLPLLSALDLVGTQTNKPSLRVAFQDIEQSVSEGKMLSASMRKHPKIFNALVVSLVEAGEVAGTLDQTLEIAATQLEREADLRRKVKAATLYPKLVVLACIGTIAVMLTMVVPAFGSVYKSLHADLPFATILLMKISDWFIRLWWIIALALVAVYYGVAQMRKTPEGSLYIDTALMKIPVLGPVLRKIAIARFVQTLAGALKGGVPVLQSLGIAGSTAGNMVIRNAVSESAKNVRDGSTISEELDRTGEFPIMVTRMVAAGEATGNLDNMLEEINRFYEQDVEYAVGSLTRLIEPIMTIVVGFIVLLVLLAMYMPVFSLGKAFQGQGIGH